MKSGIARDDMDQQVRPGDDLFRYANGAWFDRTEIPSDRGGYNTFIQLAEAAEVQVRDLLEEAAGAYAVGTPQQLAGDLYASFTDVDRVEALGAQPLDEDLAAIEQVGDTTELVRLVGRLQRTNTSGFVQPFVDTDARASDRYIVYLEQAGLGLPDESYYREEQYQELRAAYVSHIEVMLGLAGMGGAADAARAVMALETRLAAGHWDNVASRDAVKSYTKLDRAALADLTPGLDWGAFVEGVAGGEAFEEVVGRQPSFLRALAGALREVDLADWKSWLRWHLVSGAAPYLSEAFVAQNFDFYGKTLTGTPQLRERWKRGVALVNTLVGEAAGQLYVERHFPPQAKAAMEELVDNLVEAYRRDITALDWMGEQTKAKAIEKLEAFRSKIGYPDKWRDYSALRIEAADLFGNVARANAFESDRHFAKIGGPVDREEWFMPPQMVNAYYNPGMNEIVFPAAILQPPFFDMEAEPAANYGGIGAIIGHEIGHGFDDQGSRYDGQGNLVDWWTEQDRSNFEQRATALIEQYNALEPIAAPGHKVNGALTVGENIGDLGGLTIGYAAYQVATECGEQPQIEGFTGAQRVFLGWAQVWKSKTREQQALRALATDPHSPTELRANIVRNLVEFYDAFDVRDGQGLYLPEGQRVRIW